MKVMGEVSIAKAFALQPDANVSSSTILEYRGALKKWGFVEKEGGIALVLQKRPLSQCEKTAFPPAQKKSILDNNGLQTYFLKISESKGNVKIVTQACGADGFFYALQTLKNLWKQAEAPDTIYLYKADIIDFPAFPVRAVFEGGYGIWSQQGRLDVLDWMGSVKLNSYLYGPKSDPKIRRRWRELYDDIELFAFKRIMEKARENHIQVGYVISPPLGIEYGSEEDFKVLFRKVKQMLSLGMKSIVLAFDDTMGMMYNPRDWQKFANLAEAESYLTNKLYDAVKAYDKEAVVVMVPEIYAGVHKIPYNDTLIAKLNPEVVIGWTGMEIGTPKLDAQDMKAFIAYYKRMPPVGDNWGALYPILARKPEIVKYTTQFGMNPYNLQGELPLDIGLPLKSEPELMPIQGASLSEFSWNANFYNPDAVLDKLSRVYFKDASAHAAFILVMHRDFYDLLSYYPLTTDYIPPIEKDLKRILAKKDDKMLRAWVDESLKQLEKAKNAPQLLQDGCVNLKMGKALAERAQRALPYFEKVAEALKKVQSVIGDKTTLDAAVKDFISVLRGK